MEFIKNRREFKGAVIGTLLGDGSLSNPEEGNCRLTFSQKDHAYTLFKVSLFEWLTKVTVYADKDGMLCAYTARHPFYTKLYDRMYYEGRKTVTLHVMKSLTPLGLALWYMDDGNLHKDKLDVKLYTNCFNFAEHLLMQKILNDLWGLRFNILSYKIQNGKKYLYLRLKNADREKFFNLISPYVIPSMKYKTPQAEGMEKIKNRPRLSKYDVDEVLKPDILTGLYCGNEKLSIYQMSKLLGINSGTILGRLRNLNVEIRNKGKYAPLRDSLNCMATCRAGRNDQPLSVNTEL